MQANTEADIDRLLRSMVLIGRASKRSLAGMEAAGYWLLQVLDARGPMRLTGLAAACELDNSTVSRHARSLEADGLVVRTPDPGDGRAQVLALSEAGQTAIATARAQRRALISDRLADWSPDDVATLTDLLSRLADDIEASQNPRKHA